MNSRGGFLALLVRRIWAFEIQPWDENRIRELFLSVRRREPLSLEVSDPLDPHLTQGQKMCLVVPVPTSLPDDDRSERYRPGRHKHGTPPPISTIAPHHLLPHMKI